MEPIHKIYRQIYFILFSYYVCHSIRPQVEYSWCPGADHVTIYVFLSYHVLYRGTCANVSSEAITYRYLFTRRSRNTCSGSKRNYCVEVGHFFACANFFDLAKWKPHILYKKCLESLLLMSSCIFFKFFFEYC